MKKIMLFLGVIILCSSCGKLITDLFGGPDLAQKYQEVDWAIINKTEQSLKIKSPYFMYNSISHRYETNGDYRITMIEQGDTVVVMDILVGENFEDYFTLCQNSYGEEVYWQILSEDDIVLKTWTNSDIEQLNQRFFEKSSWKYVSNKQGNSWIFEILSDDIK
jgi:hypothetical protein